MSLLSHMPFQVCLSQSWLFPSFLYLLFLHRISASLFRKNTWVVYFLNLCIPEKILLLTSCMSNNFTKYRNCVLSSNGNVIPFHLVFRIVEEERKLRKIWFCLQPDFPICFISLSLSLIFRKSMRLCRFLFLFEFSVLLSINTCTLVFWVEKLVYIRKTTFLLFV